MTKRCWLVKSEPLVYSIDDLKADGECGWEGVRNYQARNLMRDELKPGDPVYVELPYAKLTYRITGHRIVEANALGVLRSHGHEHLALQACHPRFFATQRYIADAELVRFALVENDTLHPYTVVASPR